MHQTQKDRKCQEHLNGQTWTPVSIMNVRDEQERTGRFHKYGIVCKKLSIYDKNELNLNS